MSRRQIFQCTITLLSNSCLFILIFVSLFFCSCSINSFGKIGLQPEILSKIEKECESFFPCNFDKRYQKTEKGSFGPTDLIDINECFGIFIKPGMAFLDLGSGDGRVIFLAALYGANATGIEYNETLYKISTEAAKELSKSLKIKNINFIKGDYFAYDFSKYDIFYLFGENISELEKKLSREMKKNSLLITYEEGAPFNTLRLIRIFPAEKIKVYQKVN